jgi:hypothetical protein
VRISDPDEAAVRQNEGTEQVSPRFGGCDAQEGTICGEFWNRNAKSQPTNAEGTDFFSFTHISVSIWNKKTSAWEMFLDLTARKMLCLARSA